METRGFTLKITVDELKAKFLSKDFEQCSSASKQLLKLKNISIVDFFIENLKNRNRKIQMSAASALRKLASDRAIQPLLNAIKNTNNKNYTGSFVYALQTHNYQDLLIAIVKIALNGTYEAQNHALQMLADGKFQTDSDEIEQAKSLVRDYVKRKHKCDNYDILLKEITRYLSRIEKKNKEKKK